MNWEPSQRMFQVPFGRYKNKPFEAMVADKVYARLQLKSASLWALYPEFMSALEAAISPQAVPVNREQASTGDDNEPLSMSDDTPSGQDEREKPRLSRFRLTYVYQWLTSFNMETRREKTPIAPPSTCRFLIEYLPPGLKQEFDQQEGLTWREWNGVFGGLKGDDNQP